MCDLYFNLLSLLYLLDHGSPHLAQPGGLSCLPPLRGLNLSITKYLRAGQHLLPQRKKDRDPGTTGQWKEGLQSFALLPTGSWGNSAWLNHLLSGSDPKVNLQGLCLSHTMISLGGERGPPLA
jgi:hypothetical protein